MHYDVRISRHMTTDIVENIKPREKMTMKITTITKELSALDSVNICFAPEELAMAKGRITDSVSDFKEHV